MSTHSERKKLPILKVRCHNSQSRIYVSVSYPPKIASTKREDARRKSNWTIRPQSIGTATDLLKLPHELQKEQPVDIPQSPCWIKLFDGVEVYQFLFKNHLKYVSLWTRLRVRTCTSHEILPPVTQRHIKTGRCIYYRQENHSRLQS